MPVNGLDKKNQHQQYTIEQFLETTCFRDGAFSYDENRILFSSDKNGIFNVYSISAQTNELKQLTFSTNRACYLITAFPKDNRFLYQSDELGNELSHIYLYSEDNTIRDLTPDPKAKSEFFKWSHDKTSFFYRSNSRDPHYFDLYEMDIDTFTPTLVYINETGFIIDDISPDKRYLSLTKLVDSNSTELYLGDLLNKSTTLLIPYQEDVNCDGQCFDINSKKLYFLTDADSDFMYLSVYNLETGLSEIVEKYDWDILSCKFSNNFRYRSIRINENSQKRIKIYDQLAEKFLKLPPMLDGEIADVLFSKSEKFILFYVNGDRSPTNIYLYDIDSRTCKKLTQSLNPEINPSDLVEAETIEYPSFDGTKIPALYYPARHANGGAKSPALIWVHGGPGGQSSKSYEYLIQYLVNHGYTVLAVNNRGSSGYGKSFFKAADGKHGDMDLDDCISGKQFLMAKESVDPNRIGIIGSSYGGYITLAALSFRPNEMKLGIDIFGVSNWVRTLKNIPSWWEYQRHALYKRIGNPDTNPKYLEGISPLFHADKISKPLLVIQGANDPRVLKIESDQIIEAVQKNKIPCQYEVFMDEGHGFVKKQNRIHAAKTILDFLNKHI